MAEQQEDQRVTEEAPWYVARLTAGATRKAPLRLHAPKNRKDESIVERSLRDEGFGVYLPRMQKEIRHHRTKAIITRSFPLFTGYAFVDRATGVGNCDGVAYVLGHEGRPFAVPASYIDTLRDAEQNMVWDDTRAAKIKRGQEGRNKRETTAIKFPPGSSVRVTDGPFAGFHGHVRNVTGRGYITAMVAIFGGLTPVELDPRQLEASPLTRRSHAA